MRDAPAIAAAKTPGARDAPAKTPASPEMTRHGSPAKPHSLIFATDGDRNAELSNAE
jgi:hypothetical protein